MSSSLHIVRFYYVNDSLLVQFFTQNEITGLWDLHSLHGAVYCQPRKGGSIPFDALINDGEMCVGVQEVSGFDVSWYDYQYEEYLIPETEAKVSLYLCGIGDGGDFFVIASRYERESIGFIHNFTFEYYAKEINRSIPTSQTTLPEISCNYFKMFIDFKTNHFLMALNIYMERSYRDICRVIRFTNYSAYLLVSVGCLEDVLKMTWREFLHRNDLFFKISNPLILNKKMGANFIGEIYAVRLGGVFVLLLDAERYDIYEGIDFI